MNANMFVQILMEVTVKSVALIVLCWMVTTTMRRTSAAWKHALWTATMAASLLLFPFTAFAPAWHVVPAPKATPIAAVLPSPEPTSAPTATMIVLPSETAAPAQNTVPMKELSESTRPQHASLDVTQIRRRPSWQAFVFVCWLVGFAALMARSLASHLALRKLVRRSKEVEDEQWVSALRCARQQLSLSVPVTLVSSDQLDVPVVFGAMRPRIVIPNTALEWNRERRLQVMLHELAHVKRADLFTQWIGQVGAAVFWFNPLQWFVSAQIQALRERACDDLVIRHGAVPSQYAQELLSIVSQLGPTERFGTALAMARRSQLEGRLLAILNPALRRRAVSGLAASALAVFAFAIAFPAAALKLENPHPVFAAQPFIAAAIQPHPEHTSSQETVPQESKEGNAAARAETGSDPQTQPTVSAPSDSPLLKQLAACSAAPHGSNSHTSMNIIDDDGRRSWIVKWSRGDCTINLNSQGTIKFNDDFTTVASISNGGFVDMTMTVSDETQRARFEPSDSGVRTWYWRNGKEVPMDAAAQAWLRDFFIMLDRQTAFAIDYRYPQLLKAGGPQRVVQEVKAMLSDYPRSMYLQRLLKEPNLKTVDFNSAINATLDMQSDYEIARVLIAGAERHSLQEPSSRDAYLRALDRLKSDYEHARVLLTFFGKTQIPPELAKTVLQSAAKIKSDYELARVLIEMADKKMVTKETEADYVATIAHLKSDYEHARTLINYLEQYGSDAQRLGPVIDQAGDIKSDYEASRVLMTVAQYHPQGAQREAYIRVANEISSEYERKRALAAIGYQATSL